jgi:hypothetical protein
MKTIVRAESWMGQLVRAYEKILSPNYENSTLDKANDIVCKALQGIEELVKTKNISKRLVIDSEGPLKTEKDLRTKPINRNISAIKKIKDRPLKAHEVLLLQHVEKCPECHNPVAEDWDFKDFSSKTIAVCPQCKTEIEIKES